MSKLRYRAWDKKNKEMFEVSGFNFELGKVYKAGEVGQYVPLENVILMQGVGIEDINGVHIYVGDEVRCWSGREEDYLDYRELIAPITYEAPDFKIDGSVLPWNAEFIEVVGNIYESV